MLCRWSNRQRCRFGLATMDSGVVSRTQRRFGVESVRTGDNLPEPVGMGDHVLTVQRDDY